MIVALAWGLGQPSAAQVSVGVAVRFGPPPLRLYAQPWCPGPGYLWVPGYWAWDGAQYFWVPGQWLLAPEPGLLWTPGYWGWNAGFFSWHRGYWGPRVGFYGGIAYGYGYDGFGYRGGYWRGGVFFYNRAVNRVNVTLIRNVYSRTVVVDNRNVTRVSYNGGPGGVAARPTRAELAARRQRRFGPVAAQARVMRQARANPRTFAARPQRGPQPGRFAPPARAGRAAPPRAERHGQRQPRRQRSDRRDRHPGPGR